MAELTLKVGELAKRTGLTVRTLHWYDEMGLLSPARRTLSGHRLYGPAEIERLQKILSLRQVGLALEEIQESLDSDNLPLLRVLELHAGRLAEEAERLQLLRDRLDRVIGVARESGRVEPEELIRTMEAMAMFEKYYTPEQLEKLAQRKEEVGEERIQEAQREWQELYRESAELQAEGAAPDDPRALALGRKAESLIREFTGGDPGIRASLANMYRQEGTRPLEEHGMEVSQDSHGFLNQAMREAALQDDSSE